MLEVKSLGKELRHKTDPETGMPLDREPPEWQEQLEVRASGKDVDALRGAFKESSQRAMHQAENWRKKAGSERLPSPDGKMVEVPGFLVDSFRSQGFGRVSVRPTFTVRGFGGMKREGLRRARYVYRNGERITLMEER